VVAALRRLACPPEWLIALSEPDCVARALTKHVPELAAGELTLAALEVKGMRTKERSRSASYRLAAIGGDGAERTFELRGEWVAATAPQPSPGSNDVPLGTDGWRCYLPELRLELHADDPSDAGLPALPLLTDPVRARAVLEAAMRKGSPRYARLQIAACRPRVARYSRGSRCTVVYDLLYASALDVGPDVVVAKTYRGEKGRAAFDGMRALWGSLLRERGDVLLAEPLAFLPELNVVLQTGLPHERTLKQLIATAVTAPSDEAMAEVSAYVAKTAAGLAALHASGVRANEVVTLDDELAEIRQVVARLAPLEPEVVEAVAPLLAYVESVAAEHLADPVVPAHRSFRPAQVLLNRGEIAFIDFDGFCLAEPALDLALFCATFNDLALRASILRGNGRSVDSFAAHIGRLDELCELFLAHYEAAAPVSRPRVALWQTLDLLTAVLHCWTKGKFDWLDYRLRLLQNHLSAGEIPGSGG
jgi:phosphotransferase family enzyme